MADDPQSNGIAGHLLEGDCDSSRGAASTGAACVSGYAREPPAYRFTARQVIEWTVPMSSSRVTPQPASIASASSGATFASEAR